jgi:hypothetical protein
MIPIGVITPFLPPHFLELLLLEQAETVKAIVAKRKV